MPEVKEHPALLNLGFQEIIKNPNKKTFDFALL